ETLRVRPWRALALTQSTGNGATAVDGFPGLKHVASKTATPSPHSTDVDMFPTLTSLPTRTCEKQATV
uniref:hypothetical protein n=1 Tax=Brasilonema bromeliae TaxID=383615 RepID=UPI001B7CDCE9